MIIGLAGAASLGNRDDLNLQGANLSVKQKISCCGCVCQSSYALKEQMICQLTGRGSSDVHPSPFPQDS